MILEKAKQTTASEGHNMLKRIMLFELSVGGHYPEYIAHLVYYWCNHNITGQLNIVVSPRFVKQHSEIQEKIERATVSNICLITITQKEYEKLRPFNNGINRNLRAWQEVNLAKKYAKKLRSNFIFFPYFDTRQLPLILGQNLDCSYSGIYFRPSFHYQYFENHPFTIKYKIQQWREKLTLSLLLKDRKLANLFCLDPFAVKQINILTNSQKASYISDPVKVHNSHPADLQQKKSELRIERSRQIFLLFGGIDSRKGLDQLLESIRFIPHDLYHRLCILVVGLIDKKSYQSCSDKIDRLCQKTAIQIIIKDQYIPEIDIQKYFELSDVILSLYQNHVGMSGIINRAAATQKPVLSSNYGLMGEITRCYQLGLTVDSTAPEDIAKGLTKFLSNSSKQYCDLKKMQDFAQRNTPEKFAQTIFQHIFTD